MVVTFSEYFSLILVAQLVSIIIVAISLVAPGKMFLFAQNGGITTLAEYIFIVISGYAINGNGFYLSFKGNRIIIKNDTLQLIINILKDGRRKT